MSIQNNIKVLKFGGTSVKDIGRMHHVAEIITNQAINNQLIVVVSAMGDTTDNLLKQIRLCSESPPARETDQLISIGEQISISLLTTILIKKGLSAISLTAAQAGIKSNNTFGKAKIIDIDKEIILSKLQSHRILVIAGFQAITSSGETTTLGRGGSDTTALALAAGIEANSCDIYTDVDGIFSANPNEIKEAKLIPRISFSNAKEMAKLGAQVIHPRAVNLAQKFNFAFRIRNTFNPQHPGTLVYGVNDMENYQSISGIAIDQNQILFSIRNKNFDFDPDFISEIFNKLHKENISAELIGQIHKVKDDFIFTAPSEERKTVLECLESIRSRYTDIEFYEDDDCAKVSIIGSDITSKTNLLSDLFKLIAKKHISYKYMISSHNSLTCIVSKCLANLTANYLHQKFIHSDQNNSINQINQIEQEDRIYDLELAS